MSDSLSSLFEFLPIGAYRSTPDGTLLRANPALVRMNGYPSEAALLAAGHDLARDWYQRPGRRETFLALLARVGQVTAFVSEVRCLATGDAMWVRETAHQVMGEDGQVRYIEGTIEDVTAQREAERVLAENNARWQLALESVGDGVWDWDLVGGRERYSSGFLAMYGYTPEDLAEDPTVMDGLTHPDDVPGMRRDRDAHFSGATPRYVNEHRVRCRDGQWKWVLSRGLVIERDERGQPRRMIGTHTDITARRQADALRAERDRADAANQAKSQLLSRVSHELRTPLNAVLGFAQLLEQAQGLDAGQRAWATHILQAGQHLLALVDDVLDLSSAQGGQLSIATRPLCAHSAFDEAWSLVLAGQAPPPAGLSTAPSAAPAAAPTLSVLADAQRLRQVLVNLLSNAIKFNRAGGAVRRRLRGEGRWVVFEVQDEGPGLSPAEQARLFSPFDRLGADRRGIPGTGLGLVLARQLTQAMGGELRVESSPGQGACFSVWLLAAQPAA